jgi:N-acetyl sugar amidotransferase
MAILGRYCSRGVWDESVPSITFNEQGVSNYALLFDKLVEAYPRGNEGLSSWNSLVKRIKRQGRNLKYDCVIGVSGGTDSCYLLHLAKEFGLRPLAVNLDNGWNSDIAVKNIKKITSALHIDLVTYVIDYDEVKDLIKAYMKAGLPWIDIPTDLAIKAVLYKIASKEGIKNILRGNDFRSEGTQPTEWTYGDGRQLKYIHKKYGVVKLKTFPNYTISSLVYYGFVKGIKSIYPYYYLDYNKNKAQSFLTENYKWEYYGGHHHENVFTKFVISYWLFERFGIDKRKITLSAQILSGEILKEVALKQLEEYPYDTAMIESMIDYVLKKLDLTRGEFNDIMNSDKHTFADYPSYTFIFGKMRKYFSPMLGLIFLHKPQSLFKAEIIEK